MAEEYSVRELHDALSDALHSGDKQMADMLATEIEKAEARGQKLVPKTGAIEGAAKAVGAGLQEGVAGMLQLPKTVMQGHEAMLRQAGGNQAAPGLSESYPDVNKYKAETLKYEPQSTVERFLKAGSQGVPGAMTLNPGGMGLGFLSGVLGEAGQQAAGTPGEVGGSLIPSLASVVMAARRPGAVKAFQGPLENVSPEELKAALARKIQAEQTLGGKFSMTQGFDKPNQLEAIQQEILRQPGGNELQRILSEQPGAAYEKLIPWIKNLGMEPSNAAGNAVRAAGNRVFEDRYAQGNATFGALVDAAKARAAQAPRQPKQTADDILRDFAGEVKGEGDAVSPLAKELSGTAGPKPHIRLKVGAERAPAPPAPEPKISDEDLQALMQAKGLIFGPIKRLERSAFGAMFPKGQRGPSATGDIDAFSRQLFGSNRSAKDIELIAKELNGSDSRAFPAIVRRYIQGIADSTLAGETGQKTAAQLGDFAGRIKNTFGKEKFDAAMRGVANAKRMSPEDAEAFVRNANALMDAVEMTGRGVKGVGEVSGQAVARESGKNWFSSLIGLDITRPGAGIAESVRRKYQMHVYKEMGNALTSDDAVRELGKIRDFDRIVQIGARVLRGATIEEAVRGGE